MHRIGDLDEFYAECRLEFMIWAISAMDAQEYELNAPEAKECAIQAVYKVFKRVYETKGIEAVEDLLQQRIKYSFRK